MKSKSSKSISEFLHFRIVVPLLALPALVIFLCACGSENTSIDSPTSTSVTDTTALLGGNVIDGGHGGGPSGHDPESDITERGVVFSLKSKNADPQIGGAGVSQVIASGVAKGVFTVSVTGLIPGAEYSFKAYAIGYTTGYTDVATFTTSVGPSTVANPTSSDIKIFGASLGGDVISDGGHAITARGVVYAATTDNADPLIGGAGVVNVTHASQTTGVFTVPVAGLAVSTDYTFKAYATTSVGTSYTDIATFSTDLVADTGTNPIFDGPFTSVKAMAIQPDGKTVVGGSFLSVGDASHSSLVRLNADGSVDSSFNPNVNSVDSLAVQVDGKIVIGGSFQEVTGEAHDNIARLNEDGTVDSSFVASADYGSVDGLAIQADGKILLCGTFLGLNSASGAAGANYWWLGRLNADGSVDTSFNSGGVFNDPNNPVSSIAVQADGKILIGGEFTTYNGVARNGVARLNANGTLDTTFVPASPATIVDCVTVQPDGKLLVGGTYAVSGTSEYRTSLTRLNANGSLDSSFTAGIDDTGRFNSVALQADGKMLVSTRHYYGTPVASSHFARLNADGSLDSSFDSGSGTDNYIWGVLLKGNGQVLIGGSFTTANDEPTAAFAKFDNGEAIQQLRSPDATRVQWLRGGTAPELNRVTFDLSIDGGTTWTSLGAGTRGFRGWQLSGQSLPASGMLRARGRTVGGNFNGSSGLTEQVAVFPSVPWIANLTSADITLSSAVLGSNIASSDGYNITARGVVYARTSDNSDPIIGGSGVTVVTADITTTGVFTQLVTGLDPNTHYTFRAYATSSVGTGYSDVQTFNTLVLPTVTSPTNVYQAGTTGSDIQVTLGGNVIADGDLPITERGVVYAPTRRNSNPQIGQSGVVTKPAAGTGLGVFTTTVNGFRQSSGYSFKAYAKNAAGIAYSPVATFETPGTPSVAHRGGGSLSSTTLDLRGQILDNGGAPITEFGVIYGSAFSSGRLLTEAELNPIKVVGTMISENIFEVTLTGLEPGATYYYWAYATNRFGRSHKRVDSFTISAAAPSASSVGAVPALVADPPVSALSAPPEAGYDPDVTSGYVQALAIQPDGKAIVAGEFGTVGGVKHQTLARLNTDGSVDSSFTPSTDGIIYSVAVQEDGKILIGGVFSTVNSESRSGIARLNADGTMESTATFNPGTGADNIVYSVALQPDGKILLGGLFDNIQNTARSGIARLNADGSVDGFFDPGTGADDAVYSMALQTDGKILLGGAFQNVAGSARGGIARLNANGSLDTTFAPTSGANDKVDSVLIQPDGNILIGGYFTTVNGTARNRIARLTTTGALDSNFDPGTGADNALYSMALQMDGKILIGGTFQNVNGTARNRIARLNSNGSHDTTFDPGVGANDEVDGIVLQADGNILIGGGFTQYDSVARNRIARVDNDAFTQSITITNATQAQWMRSGAGPEVSTVAFQISTDGGSIWTTVGNGTRIAGGWQSTSLSLPPSGTLRAVGRTSGGFLTASSGLVSESTVIALDPGDIQVEQPVATILTSGNTLDLGGVLLTDFAQRIFTISNTGLGHLAGVHIGITGTQASQFTLDTMPATSLAASGTTTFVLRFTPSSLGTKTAQLQITSNDPDESPISITLTGTGTNPLGIWRQSNFGAVTNSGVGANLYDFDGNGLENIIEYAFGLNPTVASSNQLPAVRRSGGNVFFDFTGPAGVSGVTYGAQWSTSLKDGEWMNIPDTGTPPQHLFSVPASGDTKKFIRLTITTP